jgi:hypothetical protein
MFFNSVFEIILRAKKIQNILYLFLKLLKNVYEIFNTYTRFFL